MDQARADLAYRNSLEEPRWLVFAFLLAILGWGTDATTRSVDPVARGLNHPGASPVQAWTA